MSLSIWRWFWTPTRGGWLAGNWGGSLVAELAIGALQMALRQRDWQGGELIHHSDQKFGTSTPRETTPGCWSKKEIEISMSRRGNP